MAKRFTETGIWQDEWFMELPPDFKLAYMFIKDNCDPAGIWKPNKRLAEMMIGMKIEWDKFLTEAGKRILVLKNDYWWITKFCDFQYGKLSEKCKPHLKVIEILQKNELLDRVYKGYGYPMDRVEDKEEDKEEYKEEEKEKEPKKTIEIFYPFNTDNFKGQWLMWKTYRKDQHKFIYKGEVSEQAALKELANLSKDNEETAIKIIHQSIANSWKGFFEIKSNGKQNNYTGNKREQVSKYFTEKPRQGF